MFYMAEMILKTPPINGELINVNIFPKGNIEAIEFPKGILEEFTAEYDLSKPNYSVESVSGPPNNRRYDIKCTVRDINNDNTFVTRSRNERRIKDGEHTTARQILKLLDQTYYFCELEKEPHQKGLTYVMTTENPTILKLKLYKWTNCCEFCFLRGHTKTQCLRPIRNKRLLQKINKNEKDDEFWNIPGKPITVDEKECWDIPETANLKPEKEDSWDSPKAFFD